MWTFWRFQTEQNVTHVWFTYYVLDILLCMLKIFADSWKLFISILMIMCSSFFEPVANTTIFTETTVIVSIIFVVLFCFGLHDSSPDWQTCSRIVMTIRVASTRRLETYTAWGTSHLAVPWLKYYMPVAKPQYLHGEWFFVSSWWFLTYSKYSSHYVKFIYHVYFCSPIFLALNHVNQVHVL
jgi:hypothetical protein